MNSFRGVPRQNDGSGLVTRPVARSPRGRRDWGVLAGVLAVVVCSVVATVFTSSVATASSAPRHVCRTVKVRVGKNKRHTRRIHVCVTIAPLHSKSVVVDTHSGGFAPSTAQTDNGDMGQPPHLTRDPFRPLSQSPAQRSIVGVAAPTAGTNAPPPSGPLDVSIASSDVIAISATPERPRDTFEAGEPSVADAGQIVMYTFNWDAVYSTDGGQSWTEIDPHTTFPADDGGFGCDQVVQYDPTTQVFIWVLQYHCNGVGVDLERVAWARASDLARYGAGAWKHFDLQPEAIAGKNTYLDQPRLSFTPRYLYISLNQGAMSVDGSGNFHDEGLKHGVVVRIPRSAFASGSSSLGYGYALLDTTSMRVAQNVQASTEYFVGHNGDGQLRIAWVDDNSNTINDQVINASTIAAGDWSTTTPGGDNMLGRQASSQGTAVTGVSQGGDGTVWAAWSEGRQLPNGTHQYAQPHVAFAELHQLAGHSGFTLVQQREYVNPSFAYALPDLATDASGEVAFDVYWGGGGLYYANHAVGFIVPRDHRVNAFEPVGDQLASSDSPFAGNPFFDYETIRPLAPPYGDCLAAAGIVNRKDSSGDKVGNPVFTIFSRPGVRCPPRFVNLPIVGLGGTNAPPS
jgi:hypothetical protein